MTRTDPTPSAAPILNDDACLDPDPTAAQASDTAAGAASPPDPAPDPDTAEDFAPAPVAPRLDGWTPARQRAFIELLADSGSVRDAAIRVGMSRESAYRLRRRRDAADFSRAWDAAVVTASRRLADGCLERAINGVDIPIFYRGEMVGEKRVYPDALAIFLLRHLDPLTYGALSGPKPYDATRIDTRGRLIHRLPLLLNRLLRRGRRVDTSTEYGV